MLLAGGMALMFYLAVISSKCVLYFVTVRQWLIGPRTLWFVSHG